MELPDQSPGFRGPSHDPPRHTARRCQAPLGSGEVEHQPNSILDRPQFLASEVAHRLPQHAGIHGANHLAQNLSRALRDHDLWMEAGGERRARGRTDHGSGEREQGPAEVAQPEPVEPLPPTPASGTGSPRRGREYSGVVNAARTRSSCLRTVSGGSG